MTDPTRCDFTLDNGGPCNAALPCPHHPTADEVRARIDAMKAQLTEGTTSR